MSKYKRTLRKNNDFLKKIVIKHKEVLKDPAEEEEQTLLNRKKRKYKKARLENGNIKKQLRINCKEKSLSTESNKLLQRCDIKVEPSEKMSVNLDDGVIGLSSNESVSQSESNIPGDIFLEEVKDIDLVLGHSNSSKQKQLCDKCGVIISKTSILSNHLAKCNPKTPDDDEIPTAKEHKSPIDSFSSSHFSYKFRDHFDLEDRIVGSQFSKAPSTADAPWQLEPTYQCVHCVFAAPSIVAMKQHKHDPRSFFSRYCICRGASASALKRYCATCRQIGTEMFADRVFCCVACDYYSLSKAIVDGYCASHCKSCQCRQKLDKKKPAAPFDVVYTQVGKVKSVCCCPHCSYVCHNLSLLVVHRELRHPSISGRCWHSDIDKSKFHCFRCRKDMSVSGEFAGFADLDLAYVKQVYACIRCDFASCQAAEFTEHAIRNHGDGKEDEGLDKKCEPYLKTFLYDETARKVDEDRRALFSCPHCPKLTYSSDDLTVHIREGHMDAAGFNKRKVFCCNVCYFLTCDRVELVCHGRSHNASACVCIKRPERKKFKCTYCSFITNDLSVLVAHVDARKNGKCFIADKSSNVYFCFKCPFVSHLICTLKEHWKGGCIGGVCYCAAPKAQDCAKCKARRRFFLCADCGFMALTPKLMQGHREMRGPFDNVTDNYFATASSGFYGKIFWCNHCQPTYIATIWTIKTHVWLVHGKIANERASEDYAVKYRCNVCADPSSFLKDLLRHVFDKHGDLVALCDCKGVNVNMLRLDCVDQITHEEDWAILCKRKREKTRATDESPLEKPKEGGEEELVYNIEHLDLKSTPQVFIATVDGAMEDPLGNLDGDAEADVPDSKTYTKIFRCLQCNFMTVDYSESLSHNCDMSNKFSLRDAVNGIKNDHNYISADIMRKMFKLRNRYPKSKPIASHNSEELTDPLEISEISDNQTTNEASHDYEFKKVFETDIEIKEAIEDSVVDNNSGNENDYDIVY